MGASLLALAKSIYYIWGICNLKEGREGVKWELGLALLWTGKMGFTHWDWNLATGNGMNNYKMGM